MAEIKNALSDCEWKLMNRLWERPMTIMELTNCVQEETGWSKNTVITMLTRLEAKGVVRGERLERAKVFYPVLDKKDAAKAETDSFLGKVYGGSLGLMMSAMAKRQELSAGEVAQLRAILDQLDGEGRK